MATNNNNYSVTLRTDRTVDYIIEGLDEYPQDSRYRKVQMYQVPELYYRLGLANHITVPEQDEDTFFVVNDVYYENRLDLIAHDAYKNSKLWWVIAYANNIEDPFVIPIGTTLRVPATTALYGVGGVLT